MLHHSDVSVRGPGKTRRYGRTYSRITQHLRGVPPDEANCLDLDEGRQLAELLRPAQEVPENYEDVTSQPGSPPQMEVPTEAPGEPEDIGMEAVEKMPLRKEQEKQRHQQNLEGNQVHGRPGASLGHQVLDEITYGETVGRPQFHRARLAESTEDD